MNVDSGLDDDVIWLGGLGAGSVGIVKGSGGDDVCTVDARGMGGENRFDKSVLRWSGGGGDDELVRTNVGQKLCGGSIHLFSSDFVDIFVPTEHILCRHRYDYLGFV